MGKPGSVTISIVRESGYAHIKLVDDGVGVPENLQSKLFDRFFRIDTSRANSSGLGLAIVKEICEALGGSVTACTPVSGQGLQFDIYLPFSQD
jgi:signal transduction histidine kinase